MQVQHYREGAAFVEAAGDYLFRDEVINGVLIGVAGRAEEHTAEGQRPYLATIDQDDQICLVAVMTPPHRLLLNVDEDFHQQCLLALAKDLLAEGRSVSGVTGPVAVADAFAEIWQGTCDIKVQRGMSMRVFELRQVQRPTNVAGQARWAEQTQLELLTDWLDAFNEEVQETPRPDRQRLRATVARKIERQELLVWEDEGRPVSVAGRSRPSPRGAAINCVRTPVEFRRRGYASACVAELSQRILDMGKVFCTLFTDVSNPTSNHIYQQIGYQLRGQFVQLDFVT